MRLFLFLTLSLLTSFAVFSQVGIGNTNPDVSSLLDIGDGTNANTKGILIPRVNIIDLSTAAPVTSPIESLLVYNTNATTGAGFYYWDSTKWTRVAPIRIDDLIDGKSDFDGSNDGSSVFLGIDAGKGDDATNNKNVGVGYEALFTNTTGFENVALGFQTLRTTGSGYRNIALGYQSMYFNNDGFYNLAMGYRSLWRNTSGSHNIAFGFHTMLENKTGIQNVAVGSNALQNSDGGEHSVAIGYQALLTDTKSVRNTAVGYQALYTNKGTVVTEAINNVAIGWRSLWSNTTGYENTGVGTESLLDNTIGYNNTSVGRESMKKNTASYNNTAIGYQALRTGNSANGHNVAIGGQTLSFYADVGGFNTAVGFQAGYKSKGERNVLIGYLAGTADGGGDSNVMIGYEAGFSSTGTGNVMIGNQAGRQETGSNTLYIDNTNTTTPLIYGEFDTDLIKVNGSLQTNDIKVGTNGTAITTIIKATVNADVPNVFAGSGEFVTMAVPNASIGATVFVSPQLNSMGRGIVISWARVSSAGNVEVLFTNASSSAVNPPAMDYYITVMN